MRNANSVVGYDLFDLEAWLSDGEIDHQNSCHNLFYHAVRDTTVGDHAFKKGERMELGQNIKYPREEIRIMFKAAGLQQAARWDDVTQDYSTLYASSHQDIPKRNEGQLCCSAVAHADD